MPAVNVLVSGSQMTLMACALIGRKGHRLGATAPIAVPSLGSKDTDVQESTAFRSQPMDFIAVER